MCFKLTSSEHWVFSCFYLQFTEPANCFLPIGSFVIEGTHTDNLSFVAETLPSTVLLQVDIRLQCWIPFLHIHLHLHWLPPCSGSLTYCLPLLANAKNSLYKILCRSEVIIFLKPFQILNDDDFEDNQVGLLPQASRSIDLSSIEHIRCIIEIILSHTWHTLEAYWHK